MTSETLPIAPRRIACMEVWGGHNNFVGEVSVPGNDVFVGCTPHVGDSHGGDIYYVSNCAAGLITRFVLADVAGHGSIVAESAASLRDLMRRYINTPDQSKFARALNKEFAREAGRFATALLVTYFAPTDHAVICNAGHPRPLHLSAGAATWRYLDADVQGALLTASAGKRGATNLPLGVLHPTGYEQFAIRLDRGDLLAIYSDAFLEALGPDGKPWGESGLLDVMNSIDTTDPSRIRLLALEEIARRTRVASMNDDATMVVLHHNASDPPSQSLTERIAVWAKVLGLG
ncbi:MAG: serine/threonine-protein phosphatase [Phycisphaeraceae bacterium]|nr:serine/threonine-protein phosphatase [Phycisphaeraceae bacterium]